MPLAAAKALAILAYGCFQNFRPGFGSPNNENYTILGLYRGSLPHGEYHIYRSCLLLIAIGLFVLLVSIGAIVSATCHNSHLREARQCF